MKTPEDIWKHIGNIPRPPGPPRHISTIAQEIRRIWSTSPKGVNYAAKPYLDAMCSSDYSCDDVRGTVLYFLGNATRFRGKDASRLKLELRAAAGIKAAR